MSAADANHHPVGFQTTRWSLVAAARQRDAPGASEALSVLCAAYWYPLYAFVRRQGHTPDEAQDLTQEFFARLLDTDFLVGLDPTKGRFRAYMLAACRHFLANEYDKARAQKRGGGREHLTLDFPAAEQRYLLEPTHELTAEKLFDRRWALTLLDQVLGRLRNEFARTNKLTVFDRLKSFLTGEGEPTRYSQVGADLGLSEGAVKVAVHRLRKRYRELLLEEIGRTVADTSEIDEEIRQLFAALRS